MKKSAHWKVHNNCGQHNRPYEGTIKQSGERLQLNGSVGD